MADLETQNSAEKIIDRMEITLNNLEQMSFDSINTTDRMVMLLSEAREYHAIMRTGDEKERLEASEAMGAILDQLLKISFKVNNLSHQLERETVYQRDTAESIRQVIDFLYSLS